MNPTYIKLAQLAYDIVLQTMLEGEKTHPVNDWQEKPISCHLDHANGHIYNFEHRENLTEALADLDHAITRLVIIKFLEDKNHENIQKTVLQT